MKIKAVSGIMVTLLLTSMLTLVFNIQPLEANPVYPGEVVMTREDIDVSIFHAGSVVQARVNGTYAFFVIATPPSYVRMYYPVPPDASNISVKIDETPLVWKWDDYDGETYYHTVIGDYPFICWTISPVPANFTIRTHYEHTVPLIEGKYKFLYAMGTGRYLAEPKECEAYVKTYISKDVAPTQPCIEVYLVTEEEILEPATYEITSLDEVWNVTYYVTYWYWSKDFLVTVMPVAESRTWTVDDDGPADFYTIQEAINAASLGDTIFVYSGTYYENVVVNKSVSLIGENRSNTIIDGNSTGNVVEVTASNVKITGFTIQESVIFYPFGCGIYVGERSSGNNISYNIITKNSNGIKLFNSSSNLISENNIKANEFWGISLKSSKNNRISGNDITNNDYGIELYESSNNNVSGNNIANNKGGIWLDFDSLINIISGNNITNNWSGFWLGFGIGFQGSSHNFIYHNNFVNNYEGQVFIEVSVNFWDDGYPSGGNYWSDYEERYPDAKELDDSGIWDTPYVIDLYNQDNYPLVSPWIPVAVDTIAPMADAGPDQTVDEDTLVTFDGSASWDNVGIESYTWTFTDVTPQTLSGENPTYNFTTPGTYIVTLTVEDAVGNTASDTVTITVLLDTDGDGTPDVTDPDDDNDEVNDDEDAFPFDSTERVDTDGDGTGNNADTDDDNDGMPDIWETENGLNPLDAADASLDPDGDGLTNLQEYQGDTDPNGSDAEAVPLWILGATAAVVIGIAVATIVFLLRRRK